LGEHRSYEALKNQLSTLNSLVLPHRPPFVFVRELIKCDPGVFAETATSFAPENPIFAGHFPGNPLVPASSYRSTRADAGIAAASGYSENASRCFFCPRSGA